MTKATLLRRVQRLEAVRSANQEVSLQEVVLWSYESAEKCTASNPEYAAFCRRLQNSPLGRLLAATAQGLIAKLADEVGCSSPVQN